MARATWRQALADAKGGRDATWRGVIVGIGSRLMLVALTVVPMVLLAAPGWALAGVGVGMFLLLGAINHASVCLARLIVRVLASQPKGWPW